MRPPLRLMTTALVAGLAATGTAQAAVTGAPSLSLAAFTKGSPPFLGGSDVTFNWGPATFEPPTADDQVELRVAFSGSAFNISFPGDATSGVLRLYEGQQYAVSVLACVSLITTARCHTLSPGAVRGSSAVTRIDVTPPSGTMQINGGAVGTNDRAVTLSLAAADPLIDGIPGSSSGVSQVALDADGDGTYPCSALLGGDTGGCAVGFAPTLAATLTPGDGPKTVGVTFGDGARPVTAPCPPGVICVAGPSLILGNASPAVLDAIILDTVRPIAVATQDRLTMERGGEVGLDAFTSRDPNPAIAAGVDPPGATWEFRDGTPVATGQRVSHAFTRVGTFVGELRVRDRAGNRSDPRPFSVTVTARPGDRPAGAGTVGAVTAKGNPAFRIDRVRVRARYARSRLRGTIRVTGRSTRAGALRAELRTPGSARVRRLAGRVRAGAFTTIFTLPADLLPGTHGLAFVGPGGTRRSSLTLIAPREGVLRGGWLSGSGRETSALFTLAARPAKALRARLTVSWSQGPRRLGEVAVPSGRRIRAGLPAGATLGAGRVRAELRAGGIVVGSATAARP